MHLYPETMAFLCLVFFAACPPFLAVGLLASSFSDKRIAKPSGRLMQLASFLLIIIWFPLVAHTPQITQAMFWPTSA